MLSTIPLGKIRVTPLALLSLLAGLVAPIKVSIVGELYLSELVLPLAGLVALGNAKARTLFRQKWFWLIILSILVTLAGYVISDYIRGSAPAQYMRGWARPVVLASNLVSFALIAYADRRNLWWFAAGFGAGGVLYARLVHNLPISLWKHGGYAEYFTVGFAAFSYFLPARVASAGFAVLAALSVYWDFRIHAGVCLVISAVMWLRGGTSNRPIALWKAGLALTIALGVAWLAVQYNATDADRVRHQGSDVGRSFGIQFGIQAGLNSPIIGYGSWSSSPELQAAAQQVRDRLRGTATDGLVEYRSTSGVHSQLLQAWVEGGILGTAFFLTLLFLLLRFGRELFSFRPLDALTPIFVFYFTYTAWHVFMSPFALGARTYDAMACAVVLVLILERQMRKRGGYGAGPVRARSRIAGSGRWTRPVRAGVSGVAYRYPSQTLPNR
jgi:hypothetical protein